MTIADDYSDFADLIVDTQYYSLEEFQKNQQSITNKELLDEFNLFYVAITRAKKEIVKDSSNFHYLMANNINSLVNRRIKETKEDIEQIVSVKATKKKKMATKLQQEDKQFLRQKRNKEEGKAKNSGLRWSVEDKKEVKSMFNKNHTIFEIADKLERTYGSILGELVKSEVISKEDYMKLSQLEDRTEARRDIL